MSNPLENNMVLYYLNALGSGLAGPDDPMQAVGAVTKQTIAAQSQMNLIKKFLSGGGNLSQKEGKINYTGDVSAFLAGDEKSALGTVAPSALTEDVGNLYKPKAAPGGGGMDASKLMLMNLLGGGNALNPSDSSLDISGADLVGLTPENITQALQLKLTKESLEQKRISDFAKMMQPTPAAPIKLPGVGKLSLKQWQSLPTRERSYAYYVFTEEQRGDEPLEYEEWVAKTDAPTQKQLYDIGKKDLEFAEWLTKYKEAGAIKIDIAGREVEKGLGKGKANVMSPGYAQDVREGLMKDKANWPSEKLIKQYTDKGLLYIEAEERAQKRMVLETMDKQIRQAFKGKKVEFLFDGVEDGKEGWYVDGVFKSGGSLMGFEEFLDKDSKFEHLLGDIEVKESPFEKVLGEIKPVEASLTDLKPTPKIDLQSKTHPESFIGRQMKGMEASLGLSKEEFDILETEIISQESRDSFMESVGEVATLAGQPYDIAKGAGSFIMAGIPTFLLGIGGAVSEMNKELPQLIAGYSNLLDMFNAAERGFVNVSEYMESGKEKVEDFLEFPRKMFKSVFGEPLSELLLGKPIDSDLVGEIAMVPMTVAEKPFAMAAESEKVKTFAKAAKMLWLDKVFVTEDNIRGALKFAGFFAGLAALHKVYRGKPGVVKDPMKQSVIKDVKEVVVKAEKIAETEMLVEKTLEGAIKAAQEKILKMEKQQLELEAKKIAEDLKKEADVEKIVKDELKVKGKKIEEIKSGLKTAEERQVEIEKVFKEEREVKEPSKKEKKVKPSKAKPKIDTGESLAEEFNLRYMGETEGLEYYGMKVPDGETTLAIKGVDRKALIKRMDEVKEQFKIEPEPITNLDRQTGVSIPKLESEKSSFFQTKEEAEAMAKVYEGRKIVDVEVLTQKLINDVNRAHHGDKSVDVTKVRNELSEIATRADELNMTFDNPVDFREWKATVGEAAIWARRMDESLRLIKKRSEGVELYSGVDPIKAGKLILKGASDFKRYMDDARRAKRIRPVRAAKIGYEAAIRELVDKSGNIKWEFIDKLGLKGYEIVQKLVLVKGANTIAANKLKQMQREIYGGLSRIEKHILDNLIMAERLLDIAKYKTVKEFEWPMIKGTDIRLTPAKAISYIETFALKEGISPKRAAILRRRAKGYFEWMKRPLEDLLKAELISRSEYDDLVSHKYRKIKLIDIFDKKYESKRGRKPLTVYDSGIQELARGRKTDIYEPSSEIMALEVFNRSYGRIMRQEANKALLELAKSDPKNPFVRTKDGKGGIPSGWQRIFVFDKGERKALYISEQMSKEWLTASSELPYKYGRFMQYISGSAVLRTFATGIEWGFALANIPRDVMHIYYAARVWEDGKWKSAYSPHLPIFLPQIGMDIARVFPDVVVRGKKTQNYFDYGGGMEFLVHQGLMLRKGKHLEPGLAKPLKLLSWFGETSELTTRVAIKEHIIRRKAREQGLTVEEARKNKDIQREASFVARDYMDFGQGGGITKAADNALPYLNAAVQATRGLWRTAKDNPKEFAYKTAEIGLATTLVYSAMREQCPETAKALQGSMALQNNLCIPVGDNFGFEDEKGQMRYWGFKVPLDPSQRFFKTFFEAAYDKNFGYEVDVDRITNNMFELSPVGVSSMPPTISGAIGYLYNKDLWKNEDVWRKTKPFTFPQTKEESIPGRTPELFKDIGELTGLSPERTKHVAGELFTHNSTWAYLMGKGYEKLFTDVPKEKVEQHWAMTLSRMPITGRFIFVTNPYSKYAEKIEKEEEIYVLKRWVENRELDRLTEGYLFEKAFEKGDVVKYIKSFKDIDTRERLRKRFDFQVAIRKLPERSFWLRLRGLAPEIRASRYYDRLQSATPKGHEQLMKEKSIVTKAGGFFTENFWLELRKIRREKE